MGRSLTSWERSQRQREREDERERVASLRARERAHARAERERERESCRNEQERERQRRRREKEADAEAKDRAREGQVATWKREVATYEAYVEQLGTLHRVQFNLARARSGYEARRPPRGFQSRPYQSATFTEQFEPGVFEPLAEIVDLFRPRDYGEAAAERRERAALHLLILGSVLVLVAAWGLFRSSWAAIALLLPAIGTALFLRYRWRLRREFVAEEAARRRNEDQAAAERQAKFTKEEEARRAHFEQREKERHRAYSARRQSFQESEATRAKLYAMALDQLSRLAAREESVRTDVLSAAQAGDANALALVCEAALPFAWPDRKPVDLITASFDEHEVGYLVLGPGKVGLLIELPGDGIVPDRILGMTPGGNRQTIKAMPDKRRDELYDAFVCSFALAHVLRLLQLCPSISSITVEAYCRVIDPATGSPRDDVRLIATYPTQLLDRLDLEAVDPIGVLDNLEHQWRPRSKRTNSYLTPALPRNKVTWATPDDDGVDVPFGLLTGQRREPAVIPFSIRDKTFDLPRMARVVVAHDGSGDCISLNQAQQKVWPGGTIVLRAGRHELALGMLPAICFVGDGPTELVLTPGPEKDGVEAHELHTISSKLSGLTLSIRPVGKLGSELNLVQGELEIERCQIDESLRLSALGVATRISLRNCTLHGSEPCSLLLDGGGQAELTDCTLQGGQDGIQIVDGRLSVRNSSFLSHRGWGLVVAPDGSASLEQCRFDGKGQGRWLLHSGAEFSHVGCTQV